MTSYVEPAPHEFAANYLFDANGLTPFFAADSQVKAGGGSQCSEFYDRGERWEVTLYYQESNIVHSSAQRSTRRTVPAPRDSRMSADSLATHARRRRRQRRLETIRQRARSCARRLWGHPRPLSCSEVPSDGPPSPLRL